MYGAERRPLDELRIELAERGVSDRSSLGRLLHRLGPSLAASEQHRLDIAKARHLWVMPFFCKHAHRLAFIDETSANTLLTKQQRAGRHAASATTQMRRSARGRHKRSLPGCATMV